MAKGKGKRGLSFYERLTGKVDDNSSEEQEQEMYPKYRPQDFKPGNNFWEARSKHGTDAILDTPSIMWESACGYFEWCVSNPLQEIDYRGKELQMVCIPKVRAFTWIGLTQFLDVNKDYFTDFKDRMSKRTDEKAQDFTRVISKIEGVIYRQKFEHAAAGQLHANLISRELGLADKRDVKSDNFNVEKIEIEIVESKHPDQE